MSESGEKEAPPHKGLGAANDAGSGGGAPNTRPRLHPAAAILLALAGLDECPACGTDLNFFTAPHCPECGLPVTWDEW